MYFCIDCIAWMNEKVCIFEIVNVFLLLFIVRFEIKNESLILFFLSTLQKKFK